MNIQPRELSTVELISQQALEINRLNYKCSCLNDEITEAWHPEFGFVWDYVEKIIDLIKLISKIDKIYMLKCNHSDMDHDPNCICCETHRIVTGAKICVKGITCSKVERIHDATSTNNP